MPIVSICSHIEQCRCRNHQPSCDLFLVLTLNSVRPESVVQCVVHVQDVEILPTRVELVEGLTTSEEKVHKLVGVGHSYTPSLADLCYATTNQL